MSSRAEALWTRLAELFGADALNRKFGLTAPNTWEQAISRLKDFELERGMRRLVYSGKAHIPTLPEFLRMCREIGGDDYSQSDAPRTPPARQLGHDPLPRWVAEGNVHLLGHITRRLAARNRLNVEPLVMAKNAWAEDMREAEKAGDVPADNGKAWWEQAMRNAEAVVDHATLRAHEGP